MKIGLVTLYRGYNYGTSLQAYALKTYLEQLGYETDIIWKREGSHSGRDIRFEKLFRMFKRSILRPNLLKETVKGYLGNFHNAPSKEIKQKYLEFTEQKLKVHALSNKQLKEFASSPKTLAVVCGSDQIWKVNAANVDPMFYLQFVPKRKRVAYAPSFGGASIPDYNKKIISKYLKSIPYISVREKSGVDVVYRLTGKKVESVIDPTLLIDWHELIKPIKEDYVLLYFLDEPADSVLKKVVEVARKKQLKIYAIPHQFEKYNKYPDIHLKSVGPLEFPSIIANASCVYTDSFHGTAFSVNLNRPFMTFQRNYKSFKSQSSRITNFLELFNLSIQYITLEQQKDFNSDFPQIDFGNVNQVLKKQREKSYKYLTNTFSDIKKHG